MTSMFGGTIIIFSWNRFFFKGNNPYKCNRIDWGRSFALEGVALYMRTYKLRLSHYRDIKLQIKQCKSHRKPPGMPTKIQGLWKEENSTAKPFRGKMFVYLWKTSLWFWVLALTFLLSREILSNFAYDSDTVSLKCLKDGYDSDLISEVFKFIFLLAWPA